LTWRRRRKCQRRAPKALTTEKMTREVEDLAGRIKNDDSHESEQEEKPAPKEKKSLDDKEKQAAEERKKKKRIEQLDKRIKMLMKRKEKDR